MLLQIKGYLDCETETKETRLFTCSELVWSVKIRDNPQHKEVSGLFLIPYIKCDVSNLWRIMIQSTLKSDWLKMSGEAFVLLDKNGFPYILLHIPHVHLSLRTVNVL